MKYSRFAVILNILRHGRRKYRNWRQKKLSTRRVLSMQLARKLRQEYHQNDASYWSLPF